ncbi:MAG TPA: DUF3617 domain-containing protein [Bryobacteraceae bacterium]|jgi:hypothetical protein|nr:DUF3617 domain-containing protein [Bryobacteraceae bacterium]
MTKNVLAALILAAGVSRADDVTPLNLKPGLWETTTVQERSGMPSIPPETLARMPPEQRARIEAMTAGKAAPTTRQSCRLENDLKPFTDDNTQSCKQTIVTSTSTKQEVKMECEKGTANVTVEAKDSEHVNGLVVMHMGANGRTMDMKITITAKWISSSCGDVKPSAVGKKE